MKIITALGLSVGLAALLSGAPGKEHVPPLGLVAPLDRDSLAYASGFRLLGETVGRTISPAFPQEQFRRNLARIKKAKCKVYLCNVLFTGNLKIAGPNVDDARVVAYADSVFTRAQQAGIPLLVLGSGGARRIPEGYDAQQAQADFVVLCRKLAVAAQKHGLMIAIESLETAETNFLLTLRSTAAVVRAVDHPHFRLNADIFHMMREGESPQSIVEAKDILVHCEIAEKEKRTYPGVQGDDFKPYLRALRKAHYQGPIFIEGNTTNPRSDTPRAFAYLTKQLQEVYAEP
jgi:sugar phosphate isomerase/epimerase